MKISPILEKKISQTWNTRILAKAKERGVKVSEAKLKTIAMMSHIRASEQINENYPSTFDGINGRGGINFGNNPNSGNAGRYGAGNRGSAEAWQNLFGIFVEVAATNVGMELVPTVPATKSSGTFYVAEPVYGGNTSATGQTPWVIQVKATAHAAVAGTIPLSSANIGTTYTIVAGHAGENIIDLTFVGSHRINGNPIFKCGKRYDNSGASGTNWTTKNIADCLDSATNSARIDTSTSANFWDFTASSVDLVAGFTNFISGMSGAGVSDTDDWFMNRGDGKRYSKPMSRAAGEKTISRSMGIRTWHSNYAADTVKTDIFYTVEQMQDMENDLGMSALEFGDMAIQDQLNQHINGHILGRMFALGWQHHVNMNKANGFNMNAFLSTAGNTGSAQAFLGSDDTLQTITGNPGVLPSSGAISENLNTLQRRIITRMLYGSGIIKTRSRRGRGNQSVMNTTFATAVRDIRGFAAAPFENNIDASTDLECIGELYGMKVYEDGLMDLADQRINLSRHGNEKDPGIKFVPYILAEKLTTVPESTMAPKEQLISRYSLVEAGTAPELNYLTFTVQQANGYSVV